ncbi:MAG: amino acid ABC transporter permease [Rhodobacterales bacterium RIFCSPHIGHO2_02_FULL_62_130]|nr:MAG: amino acid ABC transporter permease [Rhodobacterales bacterium RIFCSPHIGHO2_02_FULL_62_130]OHC60846.1 MAG: amino acid ABC transporter permease [Rhodobacterales bacterium RIFCSPHIGHO2_12_FULL_62_75]HCY99343.1 amino acid ABC transporter permease [Rhodobacter sp.]
MALAADTPKDSFRLSMLIYDTRFRAITIQVIVLILVLLGIGWLVNNTIENLAAKDKDINFSFLFSRAGYDIDQQLIPYTNDSTHGRALVIGLLNTLVVAFFACIFATLIGVFAGVLRLSKNWLVGRLMTVYVEVFRNVPLLLWILLAFVIFSETMPEPKDFKTTQAMVDAGTTPAAQMILFDSVAITNRGTNIPAPLLERPLGGTEAFGVPINFSVLATLLVIAGSIWVNYLVRRRAKAVQEDTGIRPVTWWKSLLILIAPTLALLIAMGFHLEVPAFPMGENGVSKGFNFVGGINVAHSFTALLIALSLYHGTYIAEAVRSGILAISRGQTEAAYALGLRPGRTMSLIILPQALRVIIPPLISQFLNITKNTTLGVAISYLDLKGTLGGITLNQTGRELECMLLMMLIYLILSLLISSGMNVYNTAVKLKER